MINFFGSSLLKFLLYCVIVLDYIRCMYRYLLVFKHAHWDIPSCQDKYRRVFRCISRNKRLSGVVIGYKISCLKKCCSQTQRASTSFLSFNVVISRFVWEPQSFSHFRRPPSLFRALPLVLAKR